MPEQIVLIVVVVGVLIPSVILHEVSHGAVALAFGDDTAKRAGRLTLNPLPHIDPFGTVLLPAILAFTTGAAFGYARPVPVNTSNLRRPRDHGLLVSLVGPTVNIALAVLAAFALRAVGDAPLRVGAVSVVGVLFVFGSINAILAAFNLLPIPPLDGSAVVERFLPRGWLPAWHKLRQYSMVVLLVLVFVADEALGRVFRFAIQLWSRLLA